MRTHTQVKETHSSTMLSPRQDDLEAKHVQEQDDLMCTSSSRSCMDDFECLTRLGAGSFGTVYKVRRHADNCLYVLKSVRIVELTYKEQTEAINEVTILSQMDSPFVVRYYDSFIAKDSLHIIMEFCNRGDLQALVKKAKEKELTCLREHVTWNTSLQVILGLHYLHKKKILHRDLKTANVFLMDNNDTNTNEGGQQYFQVKIGDLGVAKLLETSTAFAKTIVGTPYYLSPELCSDQPYRDKSDCWALGVMMYECCTLQHPFEARNQCALIMKIIQSPVKPPNPSTTSAELSKLIMWLLQKDPINRPSIKDILCERYVQEKLLEHNLEVPRDILDSGIVTNYVVDDNGTPFKPVTIHSYGENAGNGSDTSSALNSSPDKSGSQRLGDKKARSLNHPTSIPTPSSSSKNVKSIGAIRGNRVRGPPSAKRVLSDQVLTAHQLAPLRANPNPNPFSKRRPANSRTNSSNSAASSGHDDESAADEKERPYADSRDVGSTKEGDSDATLVAGAKQGEKLSFTVGLHEFSKGELSDDETGAANVSTHAAESKDVNSSYAVDEDAGGEDDEGCNNNTDNYSYEDDFEDYEDSEAKMNSSSNLKSISNKSSHFYNVYLGSDNSTKNSTTSSNDNNNDDDNNSTGDFEVERLTAHASDSRQKLCAMLGEELFTKVYDLCSCRMRRSNANNSDENNVSAYVEDEDGEMIDSQIDDRNFVAELEMLFSDSKKKCSDALVGVQVLLAYEFKLYCLEKSRYSEEYMSLVYKRK